MKTSKFFLNSCCLFFLSFFVSNPIFSQDAKSTAFLNQVALKVKSYKNIVIDFKYSIDSGQKTESKGNATMSGDLYVMNLLGVTKIFDGKKIYTINPEDEEITISKYNEKDQNSITPSRMLTFFKSGYSSKMDIVQNIKGRKIQFVKLTPNNAKDARKEILLGVDLLTKNIHSLIEINKNGNKTSIVVNSFKTNQPLSKNQFTFVESNYPKYYINKLD